MEIVERCSTLTDLYFRPPHHYDCLLQKFENVVCNGSLAGDKPYLKEWQLNVFWN